MRHRKRVFKIGRRPDHVRSLLANQVCSLIFHGRVSTTVTRAKEVKRLAEKMVTLGKKGTLHHRRQAIARLRQVPAVQRLFSDIAPRYTNRPGGYTRIIRLGIRRGDAAPTCFLEFVGSEVMAVSSTTSAAATKKNAVEKTAPSANLEATSPEASQSPTKTDSPSAAESSDKKPSAE